jgi:hypothetical protein
LDSKKLQKKKKKKKRKEEEAFDNHSFLFLTNHLYTLDLHFTLQN